MDEQNIGSIEGDDRRFRRENDRAFMCPRCHSFHTKFCYYNNYNYSQPRHFCKSCRRYWTIGGLLRNVPVGGGSRKSKNPKPNPAPAIATDSPFSHNSDSNALTSLLSFDDSRSDIGIWSKIGNFTNCSSERSVAPFVFSLGIEGTTALKLNRVGDYYGWIQNRGDLQGFVDGPADPTAEKRARGEGFGSPDFSSGGENEGMLEISSAVDQASGFKFCGLTTNFCN